MMLANNPEMPSTRASDMHNSAVGIPTYANKGNRVSAKKLTIHNTTEPLISTKGTSTGCCCKRRLRPDASICLCWPGGSCRGHNSLRPLWPETMNHSLIYSCNDLSIPYKCL